jgi:hypothetical protein
VNQGPRGNYLDKKTEGQKSRDTVPLIKKLLNPQSKEPFLHSEICIFTMAAFSEGI